MHQAQKNVALMLMGIAVVASAGGFAVAQNADSTTPLTTQSEQTGMLGHVEVKLIDKETGEIKAYRQTDNAILDSGKSAIADEMWDDLSLSGNTLNAAYDYIEVDGTSSTPDEDTDTGVAGSETCARVQDATVAGTDGTSVVTVTVDATFDGAQSGCSTTFAEAALHNNVSSGDALARNTFSAVTLTNADDLVITWNITFT